MAKKTCPNGHNYDPNIYGNECPLCPPPGGFNAGNGPKTSLAGAYGPGSAPGPAPMAGPAPAGGMRTVVGAAPANPAPASAGATYRAGATGAADPAGATQYRPGENNASSAGNPRTVIRHAGNNKSAGATPSRKLVGFLVTYNRDANGRAYNIYEGRNFIGRDASCDISIPDDNQMSGRHLSILYRNADDKFKFRDEQSSNGTFVNKELLDDGELQNYDIIRAGSTLFIFIAIPKIS